ncbi:GumC family protein [Rhodothermus profundi]|uniref:G-rich domain on putative tyrosine kinase n=1 Tax=Rhodothermus profundi TaxID=633813 RepID=A0A1M6URX8_9BACT|nr:Wzz/FepE/Etk N-terminal domain-containing protein [Rhodothermus profundi]SHK71965.1 G-rich domain on putative tyrosine kinase [Rhodothermus profundi]
MAAQPTSNAQHERTWEALRHLYGARRWIAGITALAAIGSLIVSLLLPNWYRATARVLPPAGAGLSPLASQLLNNLPGFLGGMLGGGSTAGYERYLSILSSRTMQERLVDHFNLIAVYGLEDEEHPREAAIEELRDNISFDVDPDFEYLEISVLDRDPQRAADMANFMVAELNRINADLLTQSARRYRAYVERRYREALARLDSVLDAQQAFHEQYGLFDLEAQARGFLEYVATLRAEALQTEMQYEALRTQFGDENPQVRVLAKMKATAERRYQEALEGQERLLPVPQQEIPAALRQYFELERERLLQTRILEVLAPLYEQARFEEERRVEAVQVVDPAVPPVKKAWPRRSLIVLGITLAALALSILFVLAHAWWQTQRELLRQHVFQPPTATSSSPQPQSAEQA